MLVDSYHLILIYCIFPEFPLREFVLIIPVYYFFIPLIDGLYFIGNRVKIIWI